MRSLFTLTLGSLIAGCSSPAKTPEPDPIQTELPRQTKVGQQMVASDRCEAVRDLMVDTVIHQVLAPAYTYNYGYGRPGAMPAVDAGIALAEPTKMATEDKKSEASAGSAASQSAPSGPSHYTTTNTQEKQVDEADLVKTDGKYVYTVRNNELMIAKTWPVEDTKLAARVSFTTVSPQQLYLHGDQLIVQGTLPSGQTRIVLIDIKDRTAPKAVSSYDIDGQATSSRLVGDDLYMVQTTALQVPPKLFEIAQKELAQVPRADHQTLRPWEVQARIARGLHAKLRAELPESEIAAALPKITSDGVKTTMRCSDLYVGQDNVQLGLTAIAKISIGKQRTDLVGAMVSGGQVYASTESLYVTAPAYAWNDQGGATQQTAVHKFSLSGDNGRPAYVATGAVDGTLLNQFSMSEYQGNLRIATTDMDWNPQGRGGNHLFVMHEDGKSLKTIGQLRGLAKGERIYAGRMFGDKGYLVTFRQTDPLFTLDLSNPRDPKLVGELKINGFSSYIHPMANNLLLTVGQDADDSGRVTGLQLQVFDVSNPAKPTRRFQEKLSSWSTYSTSTASSDHHAFTFDDATGTLAIPTAGSTDDGQQYNGLVVYGVDAKRGFTLYGRVSHRQLAKEALDALCTAARNNTDPWTNQIPNCPDAATLGYMLPQYSTIDRSIVIDNYLVSLGTAGMEIHSLEHIGTLAARMRWPLPMGNRTNDVVMSGE